MKHVTNFKMMICTSLLLVSTGSFAQQGQVNFDTPRKIVDPKKPLLDLRSEQAKGLNTLKLTPDEKRDLNDIFQKIKDLGGNSGGGGDEIGLEFHQFFGEAVEYLKKYSPQEAKAIEDAGLEELLKNAEILVVDSTLDVEARGFVQNSTAYNNSELGIILLNRDRWRAIAQNAHRSAIALHEVASLAGLEKTGLYPISGKYAQLKGVSEAALLESLAVNRLQQIQSEVPKATPFQVLEKFFQEANEPLSISELHQAEYEQMNLSISGLMNYKHNFSKIKYDCRVMTEGKRVAAALEESYSLAPVALIAIKNITTERGEPNNGPLFPGKSEKKELRLSLCNDLACGEYKFDFKRSTLETSTNRIKQTLSLNDEKIITYEIRKNNGLIAFKRKQVADGPYSKSETTSLGYCYPKSK